MAGHAAHHGAAQFGRWGTANAAEDSEIDEAEHDRDALRSFTAGALKLGAIAVVVALVVPAVVPHFPPRYLTEGLGRSGDGAGEGSVGFNDTLDLSRSLNNQDQSPVLTYTTTAFTRAPLRVLATSYYSRGQWRVAGATGDRPDNPSPLPPQDKRRDYVITVTDNTLGRAAHRRALPRRRRGDGGHAVDDRPGHARRPRRTRRQQLPGDVRRPRTRPRPSCVSPAAPDSPDITDDDLTLPDRSRDLVPAWSDEVTARPEQPARQGDRHPGPPARHAAATPTSSTSASRCATARDACSSRSRTSTRPDAATACSSRRR